MRASTLRIAQTAALLYSGVVSPTIPLPYTSHLVSSRSVKRHWLRLLFLTSTFTLCSFGSIFYALGYKVDVASRTVHATCSVTLTTSAGPADGLAISINGQPAGDHFPLRIPYLAPGTYTLDVTKDGYLPWDHVVHLTENTSTTFRGVALVLKKPVTVTADQGWLPSVQPNLDAGITLPNGELWIDGQFVRRTAGDIMAAHWYSDDKRHLAYQSNGEIWLLDVQTDTTQLLVAIASTQPASFGFRNNGQIFVYKDGKTVQAERIY